MPCSHYIPYGQDDPIWACGKGKRVETCIAPGCLREGIILCDYPLGRGKTCDRAICLEHAVEIGRDMHLCPVCAALAGRSERPVLLVEREEDVDDLTRCQSDECRRRGNCARWVSGRGQFVRTFDFGSLADSRRWGCRYFDPAIVGEPTEPRDEE